MTARTPVRFALVGAGLAAGFMRRAIEANAERGARLAAIAHYDPDRFEAVGERFGVPCASLDEVLARADVDAVVIATPSGQHARQAVRAAEAGKHVLVEKPMALRRADAQRMIDACREAGVRLGVAYQRRALPLFQRVRRAIAGGAVGRLMLATVVLPYYRGADYYAQADWRGTWALDGGGVLMNQGIHLVDLLVWYAGRPVRVTAQAGTLVHDVEVEDTLTAEIQFEGGALATLAATTTAQPGFPHRLAFYGTAGGVELEGERVRRWTTTEADDASIGTAEGGSSEGGSSEGGSAGAGAAPGGIDVEGHVRLVADFVEAVREDRSPIVDGREGYRSLDAVLSIYEAAGLPGASAEAHGS